MVQSAGLYLGPDFADLVVLGAAKEGPKIIKSVRVMFDEVSAAGDKIQAAGSAIKKALEITGLKIKSVNFSIPQDEVSVRRFGMPYIPDEERANAVKFEAQRYIPFKLDDTVSAFFIASESKIAKSMDVVFVSVSKQAVEKYSTLFRESNIVAEIIDVVPIALSRVLALSKKVKTDKTTVVINVEKNVRGTVIILKEKNIYLVREMNFARTQDAVLESILSNVRLSIDYFKRESKETDVNNIIVCGDAGLQEIEMHLKENISLVEVETFNLTDEISGLTELAKRQTAAIGLAMAFFEKPGPKINLAAQFLKNTSARGIEEYRPLIVEGVAVVVILAMMHIFAAANLASEKKKLTRLDSENMSIAQGIPADLPQKELLSIEKRDKTKIDFLKGLVGKNRVYLTKKLNALGALLPAGAWINSFEFVDEIDGTRKLVLSGIIYSAEKNETSIANKMLTDIKASQDFYAGFDDVKLSSFERTSLEDKEVVAFAIESIGQPLKSSGALSGSAPAQKASAQ